MKKIIIILLAFLTFSAYSQAEFEKIAITENVATASTSKIVSQQPGTGELNYINATALPLSIDVVNALKLKSYRSTGLLKNGLLQANVNTTLFDITAGTGIISNFDNPDASTSDIIIFPSFTGILSPYLTTSNITYVAINNVPAVVMQASPFTDSQRRDLIILGAIIHSNLSTINMINNISAPSNADTNQLHDLMEAIGALNISGNKYSANGANLSLNKSAGDIFKLGINFANNWKDPHKLTIDAQTLLTLRYRTQNGTEGSDVTVLNPSVYDLNNVLTAVPSNRFSIQTVTLFQSGITRVQYGQNTYATMAEAEAAINTRAYVVEPNIALNGVARAYIILKNSTTSLQNASDAKIVEAQKFGGLTSGGVALTNTSIIAALGYTPYNDANISGTTNFIPIFTGIKTLGNSLLYQSGVNVGINTQSPLYRLQVRQGVNQNIQFRNSDYGSAGGMLIQSSNDADSGSIPLEFGASKFSFNIGNVGIGTINPSSPLDVVGTITATNYTGSATLTGTPTAPTATVGTNTPQIATMEALQAHSSSGTYTPTLTNTTNITSSTLNAAYYVRNGNLVTVTIAVQLTLAATADTVFTFSLPVSGATVVNGVGQGNLTSGAGAVNAYGIVDTVNSTTAQLRIGSPAVAGSGAGVANIIFTYSL